MIHIKNYWKVEMKNLLQTLSFVALIGASSMAPAGAQTFSGPYLGAQLGYQNGSVDGTLDLTPLALGTGSRDVDIDGFEFGAFAGFRHQLESNFVIGVELGALLSGADGSISNVFAANDGISVEKIENSIYR